MGASGDKPYKVYRGGRSKGKVPLADRDKRDRKTSRKSDRSRDGGDGGRGGSSGRQVVRRPRRRWTWRRWLPISIVGIVLLLVLWGVLGYFSVRSGVSAANGRLPEGTTAPLKPPNGLLLSDASNILLLGTGH